MRSWMNKRWGLAAVLCLVGLIPSTAGHIYSPCSSRAVAAPPIHRKTPPEEFGLTCRAVVTKVVDGDTLDCVISIPIRVRIRGIDAPELHGDDSIAGQASRGHLLFYAGPGTPITLNIPWFEATRRFDDVQSFSRFDANVYLRGKEKKSLGEIQMKFGHAVESHR